MGLIAQLPSIGRGHVCSARRDQDPFISSAPYRNGALPLGMRGATALLRSFGACKEGDWLKPGRPDSQRCLDAARVYQSETKRRRVNCAEKTKPETEASCAPDPSLFPVPILFLVTLLCPCPWHMGNTNSS